MKFKLCLILSYLINSASAQTKLINHRSHSGTDANFRTLVAASDIDNSNLGVAPTHTVRTAKLDTLIYVNDTMAIMITSRFCRNDYERMEDASLWRAGRDTVFHHPLFSKQHQLQLIKRTIKNDYNFNDLQSIIYIGYDNATIIPNPILVPQNKNPQQQQQQQQHNSPTPESNSAPILPIGLLVCMVFCIGLYAKNI